MILGIEGELDRISLVRGDLVGIEVDAGVADFDRFLGSKREGQEKQGKKHSRMHGDGDGDGE